MDDAKGIGVVGEQGSGEPWLCGSSIKEHVLQSSFSLAPTLLLSHVCAVGAMQCELGARDDSLSADW